MTIGSFEQLTWRMDPSVSFSDWTIEISRPIHPHHDQDDNATIHNEKPTLTITITEKNLHMDRYYVHRNVLAVGPRHSEYFAAQFQSSLVMQEHLTQTSKIVLDDARADVFDLLLDFVYTDQLPTLTPASATALYSLSEYFDMPLLQTRVQDFYRQHLTMNTLVDFISFAKQHHAETLLDIAVETSVQHLLKMTVETAQRLGPELLLQILQTNHRSGHRRYGFHVSRLVAECCSHNQMELSKELFQELTHLEFLPYLDAKSAVHLLSLDTDFSASSSPSPCQKQTQLTCLQQRCTQAITDKWLHIRNQLAYNESLNNAFAKVPSPILINILMKSTSDLALADCHEVEEKEASDDAPPRILVQDAGNPEVDGLYARNGLFQGVSMYTRPCTYNDESCLFSMFQCLVGSKTKRWFISVIPTNGRPGTNKDIDFFSALVTDECEKIPPATGWRKSSDGDDPAPTLLF